MLTLESQPVETTEDIVKATCGCISWVKEQQIPFLTFLLPQNCGHIDPTQLNKFLVELMIDDGMYASILTFENRCNTSRACFVKPKVVSSFPEDWCTHFYQSVRTAISVDTLSRLPGWTIDFDMLTSSTTGESSTRFRLPSSSNR